MTFLYTKFGNANTVHSYSASDMFVAEGGHLVTPVYDPATASLTFPEVKELKGEKPQFVLHLNTGMLNHYKTSKPEVTKAVAMLKDAKVTGKDRTAALDTLLAEVYGIMDKHDLTDELNGSKKDAQRIYSMAAKSPQEALSK